MLIIPIIKTTSRYPLKVFIRKAPVEGAPSPAVTDSQPSPKESQLYDVRVKLMVENTTSRTVSTSSDPGVMNGNRWTAEYWKRTDSSASSGQVPADMQASVINTPQNMSRANSQS